MIWFQTLVSSQQPDLIVRLIETQQLSTQVIDNIIQQDGPTTVLSLANKNYLAGAHLFQLSRSEHESTGRPNISPGNQKPVEIERG